MTPEVAEEIVKKTFKEKFPNNAIAGPITGELWGWNKDKKRFRLKGNHLNLYIEKYKEMATLKREIIILLLGLFFGFFTSALLNLVYQIIGQSILSSIIITLVFVFIFGILAFFYFQYYKSSREQLEAITSLGD